MTAAVPMPAIGQTVHAAPRDMVQIATGRGRMITLAAPMSDIFVANPEVADVQVRSPTQLWVFGKKAGETTVYATTRAGKVVYSATVRIGNNFDTVDSMLSMAMPDANIAATPMNGFVLLTGTVATPNDVAEAERLTQAFVGEETKVISRLRTATPLQVNLQVRFAEVSRSFVKNIGVNFTTKDTTGGFLFGLAQGRSPGSFTESDLSKFPIAEIPLPGGGYVKGPYDPSTGKFLNPRATGITDVTRGADNATMGLAGRLLGLDVLAAIDLGETIGQVTTLATPNLTALSGETASFLAGGEIPIPVAQGLGTTTVEFKQYGVSLAFTPTVLADGRISLRVRPEVSQLSSAGAVQLNGVTIPALTTRRSETTVELGSGQSMVIGGLLQNAHNNSITKTPGLGDVPILGALFRSNGFQRNETELMIVITPYLVKPVNANEIVLPTDGYKSPSDVERVLLGQLGGSNKGGDRPKPVMAPPAG
ncbi:type II and III secretion system protein family protein, partial [Sphingomonas sp.]|uniref:type II and III secretion system protein family protein n=1 Tax=Sphingomonas sp. TaxID=28214 RepID=UPI002ED7AE23